METTKQLSITCEHCGACCRDMRVPLFEIGESDELPRTCDAVDELATFREHVNDTLLASDIDFWPCCWLNLATMACRHYASRPAVCREFEVGSDECLQHRKNWNIE